MTRRVAIALVVLAAACSGDDDEAAPRSTTAPTEVTTTTATTSASTTTTTPACEPAGIGGVPSEAVVTWVVDGVLRSADGCLAEVGDASSLEWGGAGDRVLAGTAVLLDGESAEPFATQPLVLSRPTGTAVLHVDPDGSLLKREIEGAEPRDISFLAEHELAVYHPAGRQIVSSGKNEFGGAELLIADNEGTDPLPLLSFEDADDVLDLAFTAQGGLLYVAEHPTHIDLHLLRIGEQSFNTLATVDKPATIGHVVASSFVDTDIAWTEGECSVRTLGGLALEGAEPVGWLPDGALVVLDRADCDDTSPGTLQVLRNGGVDVIAEGVTTAAVRAELPPPPAPPPDIPLQAPA